MSSTTTTARSSTYWVDLLGAQMYILQGRYRTRVLEAGNPDAPALLLLHGTGGHLENYARNIPALAEYFHVIAIDLLWHGKSQLDGYDPHIIPVLVDHVIDVLDTLKIERTAVEGQSMGGWVAMQLAIQHPQRVRKLVLVTTQGYVPDQDAIPGYQEPDWTQNLPSSLSMLHDPSFDNVKARMGRILADASRLTDEAVQVRQALYQNPALAAVQEQFVREYLGSGPSIRQHVVTDALAANIAAPTLVYWGDKNRTPPALGQHIANSVQRGQFHCAIDCGHWAQFESADEHNYVVAAFLRD